MKRFTFLLLLTVVTGLTLADDWVQVTFINSAKGKPFRSVCIKKSSSEVTLFPKSYVVTFSDAPKGSGEGYYAAHASDGYVIDGEKKNKISIEDERMKPRGDGWYIYTFDKPLYVHKVGTLVGSDVPPIYILPISSDEGQSISSGEGQSDTDSGSKDDLQDESESNISSANMKKAEEEQIPPLKMLTPRHTLVDEGWTLAKTKKEDNQTCDIYVKEIDDEEDSLFTYRKGDGEFITYKKGLYKNEVVGDYKWTLSTGVLELHQGKSYQHVFPNGVVVSYDNWEEQTLYLPENLDKGYRAPKNYPCWTSRENRENEEKGFLIGNKICYLDNDGKLVPYMQEIKGKFCYVCPTDTIVDVSYVKKDTVSGDRRGNNITLEVFYKNGDRYKYVSRAFGGWQNGSFQYQVATMHRLGGILKVTKKNKPIITMEDGSTIQIEFAMNLFGIKNGRKVTGERSSRASTGASLHSNHDYDGINSFSANSSLLAVLRDDPFDWDGTMTYPDGKTEKYKKRLPMSYWNKIEEEKAVRKRAEDAAELAKKREPYIKKYGFYPGDYKRAQDVIKVGRPFGAIEEYFICKLIRETSGAKQYKVFIINSLTNDSLNLTPYVWVQNGKITSVRW